MMFKKFFHKQAPQPLSYDRQNLRPVLRCSICTGEQVAGFQDIRSGKFEEIQLIRNGDELQDFLNRYGISHIDKIY